MNVPPFNKYKFIDDEGYLTPSAQQFMDVLVQQMQLNLSDDGLVSPARTTNDINNIASPSNENSRPNGTLWYDSVTDEFKGKIGNVVKVFQLV